MLDRTSYLSQTAFIISNNIPFYEKAAIISTVILKFVSLCLAVTNAYEEAPTSLAITLYSIFYKSINKITARLVYDVAASSEECVPTISAIALRCGSYPGSCARPLARCRRSS
jgi:hypothetical protein